MDALLTRWLPNVDWTEIGYASLDTLNMLGGSLLFTVLLGLPLGVLLFLTGPRQMFANRGIYGVLAFIVSSMLIVMLITTMLLIYYFYRRHLVGRGEKSVIDLLAQQHQDQRVNLFWFLNYEPIKHSVKETMKEVEKLIALAVKEKDNFEEVTIKAKTPTKI